MMLTGWFYIFVYLGCFILSGLLLAVYFMTDLLCMSHIEFFSGDLKNSCCFNLVSSFFFFFWGVEWFGRVPCNTCESVTIFRF